MIAFIPLVLTQGKYVDPVFNARLARLMREIAPVYREASRLYREGRYDEALPKLREVDAFCQSRGGGAPVPVTNPIVECLYRLKRYKEVVTFDQRRLTVGAARLAVGLSFFRIGDYKRAQTYFEPSLITRRVPALKHYVSTPKTPRQLEVALHLARGVEHSLTYHYGDAEKEFRLASSIAPNALTTRYFLAHPRYWRTRSNPYKQS